MRSLKTISVAVLVITLFLAGSCAEKELPTSPCTFDIVVELVQATKVKFFVIPSNQEAYYYVDIIESEEADYDLPLDEVITGRLDEDKLLYEELLRNGDPVTNFEDMYLFRETRSFFGKALRDDADHRIVIAQIDPDRRVPIGTPAEMRFHTRGLKRIEGQHFSVTIENNLLVITPSVKGVPYAWDYVSKDVLDDDYRGNQEMFLYDLMAMYEEYNFTNFASAVGTEVWDLDKSVSPMIEGETYVLAVAGYEDGEFTSEVYSILFRYRKSGSQILRPSGDE